MAGFAVALMRNDDLVENDDRGDKRKQPDLKAGVLMS